VQDKILGTQQTLVSHQLQMPSSLVLLLPLPSQQELH
jgi:hypothetical protein